MIYTSRFIDVHSLGACSDDDLKKFQESPIDEYGVKVLNLFYNREVGLSFFLLEAPNRQAVEKNHEKYGVLCNRVTEVQATT
jgi:hypothetical protein